VGVARLPQSGASPLRQRSLLYHNSAILEAVTYITELVRFVFIVTSRTIEPVSWLNQLGIHAAPPKVGTR
jgi:hypothetical protein